MTGPAQGSGAGIPLPKALVDDSDVTSFQTAAGPTATPSVELYLPQKQDTASILLDTDIIVDHYTVPAGTRVELAIYQCIRARYTGTHWEFLVEWDNDRPTSWVVSVPVEGPVRWTEVSPA